MVVSGIKDSLKQQGVRLRRQRQILLDLIQHSGRHLDAGRLYQLARPKQEHAHVICLRCGKIQALRAREIAAVANESHGSQT